MKVCAIIAEFNPFHNGHHFLIEEARKQTQADAVAIIMSGNYVQRGEPAITNKWIRTQLALQNGADLVVEIPTEFAISSANYFSYAGIQIAKWIKADYLAFGSETPQLDFKKQSSILKKKFKEKNYRQNIASQLFNDSVINQSNDILALNYAYWANEIYEELKLVPIQRKNSNHLDNDLKGTISSASSIRKNILARDVQFKQAIPKLTYELLKDDKMVQWSDFWLMLKYQIIVSDVNDLNQINGISEGLEYRIKKLILDCDNFDDFILKVKNKRFTYTRIQRILLSILLNIKFQSTKLKGSRILGMNDFGKKIIKNADKHLKTKIDKSDFNGFYNITNRSDQIYQQIAPYQYGKQPIINNLNLLH